MESADDRAIIEAGYKPQLKRSLGLFASFAVPFSIISITTGIFANYGFVLEKAGPFGFWTWLLVGLGHTFVALVFAELAGRIPLTGSCYNWNTKLLNPALGWFTGWMTLGNYSVGVAAVSTTMVPILGAILGHPLDAATGCYIVTALIILQALINLYGVRLTSHTNIIAVAVELTGMIGLGGLIIAAVLIKGHFNFDFLTTVPAQPRPYLPSFLMACLLGAWTLLGFDGAADVSEETLDARRIAPKGIVSSIVASVIVGFVFIVIMTAAIPDLAAVSSAPYPLAAIMSFYLGESATKIFLIVAMIAVFSCSMVCMTAGSRVIFAMSRDERFPASPLFRRISSHHVPKAAIFLMAAIGIFFTFMADSATSLYGAATVLAALYYLITVIGFAIKAPKLPKTDTFSLGRWHWPIVVLAAAWLIIEIGILTIPNEFHPVAVATGGVLAVGIALYFIAGRRGAKA